MLYLDEEKAVFRKAIWMLAGVCIAFIALAIFMTAREAAVMRNPTAPIPTPFILGELALVLGTVAVLCAIMIWLRLQGLAQPFNEYLRSGPWFKWFSRDFPDGLLFMGSKGSMG
jgi:hypothetical protein